MITCVQGLFKISARMWKIEAPIISEKVPILRLRLEIYLHTEDDIVSVTMKTEFKVRVFRQDIDLLLTRC